MTPPTSQRKSAEAGGSNRPVDPHHKAVVGIARGSSMEDAVRHAVGLAGGLNFIKPEPNGPDQAECHGRRQVPHDDQPRSSLRGDQARGRARPERIYVSDRCFSPAFTEVAPKTINVMKYVGHLDAVEAAKKDFKAPVVALGLEAAAQELEYLGRPREARPFGGGSSRPTPRIGPTASSRPSCCSPSIT